MAGEIVARNYASALFELAEGKGALEEYGTALGAISELLSTQADFRQFLNTPRIDKREKKDVLRDSFGGKVPDQVLNFLLLVLDKRRQRLLPQMAKEYRDLLDQKLGRAHVDVTVARPVGESFLPELGERLSRVLGKKNVIPHVRVDPSLVGGIVVRSGDVVYDGSIRRRLEAMKRRLMAANVSTDQPVRS